MSPFHDLGRRRGGPFNVERAPDAAATLRPIASEVEAISLPRFAALLALGLLGLAGLLCLGVAGVVLVQDHAFPVSRVERTGPTPPAGPAPRLTSVRHGLAASAKAPAKSASPGGDRASRSTPDFGRAPRRPGSTADPRPAAAESGSVATEQATLGE